MLIILIKPFGFLVTTKLMKVIPETYLMKVIPETRHEH